MKYIDNASAKGITCIAVKKQNKRINMKKNSVRDNPIYRSVIDLYPNLQHTLLEHPFLIEQFHHTEYFSSSIYKKSNFYIFSSPYLICIFSYKFKFIKK